MDQNHAFAPLCQIYVFLISSNIRYKNLPPEDCWQGVKHVYTVSQSTPSGLFAEAQPVYMVSTPTSSSLFAKAAACFLTYQKVTPGDCRPGMQCVYTVSNPTYRGLSVQRAACLYGFKTYLTETVCWGCSQFIVFEPI